MAIPQQTIDSIRERTDIVELVGGYVDLKRAGTNHKGLCPFHDEKTPSFNVNSDRQIFHCFGCGKGGNVFTFLIEMEGVTFPEAVRALGRKCGIEVEDTFRDEERSQSDPLYEANRFAAHFYHDKLVAGDAGAAARTYLEKERGIPPDAWRRFGLGFAPDGWDSLLTAARHKGVSMDALRELKLVITREKSKGYYDYFRNRLMFPIVEVGGRVLGFGGRVMGEGEPKYLNSSESPIFSKRRTFYGMDRARDAIRKRRETIVVEGYTDLISLHLKGIENVVAVCGTALTPEHASVLRRTTHKVILFPDADVAGENAAMSAGTILLAAGLDVRVIRLPRGFDPDKAARSMSPDELLQLVADSMDYFANLDYIVKERQLSMRDQETLIRRVISNLSHLNDQLRYDVIVKELARVFGVDPDGLKLARARPGGRVRNAPEKDEDKDRGSEARTKLERLALRLILEGSAFALEALESLDLDDFCDTQSAQLYKLLDSAHENHIDIRSRDFQRRAEEAGLEGLTAEIALISVPPGNVEVLLKDTIRRVKILKIRDELAALQQSLRSLPPESEEAAAVGEHYRRLSKALDEI